MEELIRRSDAIEALYKYNFVTKEVIEREIMDIPSADRPQGEWIDTISGEHWKCSICGCRAGFWFEEENSCSWSLDMSEWLSDFCPNCGARMKGADDE